MPGKVVVAPAPSPSLHIKAPFWGDVVAGSGGGWICKMGGERGAGISEAGLEGPLRPSSHRSSSAAQRTLSRFPPALTRSLLAASLGLRFFSRRDTLYIGGGGRFCSRVRGRHWPFPFPSMEMMNKTSQSRDSGAEAAVAFRRWRLLGE